MQRLRQLQVQLAPDRRGRVHGFCIVRVKFPEYVESVQGHHLLHAAAVVVAQGEEGLICGIAPVILVWLFVGVCEICVAEGVHIAVRTLGALPGGLHAHVQPDPVTGAHHHIRIQAVTLVSVVDEHSVLVVHAAGNVVGVLVRASADREVVVLGEGVPEQMAVPVRVHLAQGVDGRILGCDVALHRCVAAHAGPDLPDYAHDGKEYRRVAQGCPIAAFREFVPEFLLPVQLLRGIHQVKVALRPEGPGEVVVVAYLH